MHPFRIILTTILIICSGSFLLAQNRVGINTSTPDLSAQLDITSTDGGLLIPRLDTSAITSPATGLLVFQPSNATFYYYNGSVWKSMGSGVIDTDGDTRIEANNATGNDNISITLDGADKVILKRNAGGETMFDVQSSSNLSTFFGRETGLNATGYYNTGFGDRAIKNTTTGNGNTAFGPDALFANTTGFENTALGAFALIFNTTGSLNTAVGQDALFNNRANLRSTSVGYKSMEYADNRTSGRITCNTALGYYALRGSSTPASNTGRWNTAVGDSSLTANTSGDRNTAIGRQALGSNASGSDNAAIGNRALASNTSGINNTAVGSYALQDNTNGLFNTAIGTEALSDNIGGNFNTALGYGALAENNNGVFNLGIGPQALTRNKGSFNTAVGQSALFTNVANSRSTAIGYDAMVFADNRTTGRPTFNTAVGYKALRGNSSANINTGRWNTAVGDSTLSQNTSGDMNTAVGTQALASNTSGHFNAAFGYGALDKNISGSNNVALGNTSLYSNTGNENMALGHSALYHNKANSHSTAIGFEAMYYADNRTTGRMTYNTALGYQALKGSPDPATNTGQRNTALGYGVLINNASGNANTYIGAQAGFNNQIGSENTVIGNSAMVLNQAGEGNTIIGNMAGLSVMGSGNVMIGHLAGYSEGGSNKLYIENSSADSTTSLIYGDFSRDYMRTNGQYEVYSKATGDEYNAGIRSIKNYLPGANSDVPAINGENLVDDYYGIGVRGAGGYTGVLGSGKLVGILGYGTGTPSPLIENVSGVQGYAYGSTAVDIFYGVKGYSSGNGINHGVSGFSQGTSVCYGVIGEVIGEDPEAEIYGVYGKSTGQGTKYAGYFDGDGVVTQHMGIGTLPAASTTLIVKAASSDFQYFNVQQSSGASVFALNDDENHILNGNLEINKGGLFEDPALNINGRIVVTESTGDEMLIHNSNVWNHSIGDQNFGSGGDHFIMASVEGSNESAGIYGDGNAITLWSAGDPNQGQPSAFVYVLDEDNFDNDGNPYNSGALKAYLNTSGIWTVSDRNRKEKIRDIDNALDGLLQLNAYVYEYPQTAEEKSKHSNTEVVGLMAQELLEVIPQAVETNEDGDYFVNMTQVIPILVEAVKELHGQNTILIEEVKIMQEKFTTLQALEQRIAEMEKLTRDR